MKDVSTNNIFCETGAGVTLELPLRRTLVRFVRYWAQRRGGPHPGPFKAQPLQSSPLQGGDALESIINNLPPTASKQETKLESKTSPKRFIPSLEGRQTVALKNFSKGVGYGLPLNPAASSGFATFSFRKRRPPAGGRMRPGGGVRPLATKVLFILAFLVSSFVLFSQNLRTDISLNNGWRTVADSNKNLYGNFIHPTFNANAWKTVDVPHNWDAYEGYRRLRHGNRHGYAWYRKTFTVAPQPKGKRLFLFFEGVGSYATVWLNGKPAGHHAGGRTTFTLDVTDKIRFNASNLLAVRADHPANIQDLPWVCGGCSDDRGFSEGSQPMGIFRPVHLIITGDLRIEPFGVHVWNDTTVSAKAAQLYYETEVKNYGTQSKSVVVINRLVDAKGLTVGSITAQQSLKAGESRILKQMPAAVQQPQLWSTENPYLYQLVTELIVNGHVMDRITTAYGIRTIRWQLGKASSKQFLLNNGPVFINGIAEYEHLLGASHAFGEEQIRTRVRQVKAAGFNAFRDAHQPHNLRYQSYWDSLGLLWWPQLSAHDWYDTPAFRNNFKTLLKEWIKERRNSPSVILWGLQNESKLPEDFARECTELIRQLDPTASSQRLVTTCNGGAGTDWDVPQNWTGTYGGNPATYAEDLKRQVLVGEYGAWRTIDLHTEGPFEQAGAYSEDRMTQLMEMKVRAAEAAKDSTAGHFMWLLTSHDNPGRAQSGEGYRELDRIGPVNYKGLLTPWEEPTDAYYMYRANYVSKEKEPMVYIVSHTWPDRWIKPGKKDGIVAYSNCDEVELFNDVRQRSLGRKKRGGTGTHFQWDGVDIAYNVLYAIGYVNGKEVASDSIVLHHLPKAPHFFDFYKGIKNITAPQPGYNYLYRINCGGDNYTDVNGSSWFADRARTGNGIWGSSSWTKDFPDMPPYFASQRSITDPIAGTRDWGLFQSFRYGRDKLRYDFPVQDGEYLIELYFTEPWAGKGNIDATGWRLFDVAVNNKTVLKNLDVWKESGFAGALKKTVKVKVAGGLLSLSFPQVASGQAVISAIAVATLNGKAVPAPASPSLIQNLYVESIPKWTARHWATTAGEVAGHPKRGFQSLPPALYGVEWIQPEVVMPKIAGAKKMSFDVSADADVYVAYQYPKPDWLKDFDDAKDSLMNGEGVVFRLYKKRYARGGNVLLQIGQSDWYPVFAVPVTRMEPAYDLKPVTSYKAVNATLHGNVSKGKVDGKDRAVFEKSSAENGIEWQIAVGVGDVYSLTVSYNNPRQEVIKGRLKLVAADGTLMKEEAVELTPTKAGKSNYINATTGSMINAGAYTVVLTATDAQGLTVNSLDVQ